jgi:hypothetical protein
MTVQERFVRSIKKRIQSGIKGGDEY